MKIDRTYEKKKNERCRNNQKANIEFLIKCTVVHNNIIFVRQFFHNRQWKKKQIWTEA